MATLIPRSRVLTLFLISVLFLPEQIIAQSFFPNVILILTDDMGWTGSSVRMDSNFIASASDYYHTPNIDSLATYGMRFSRAYVLAPEGAPSRAALQSGIHPAMSGFTSLPDTVRPDELLIEPPTDTSLSGAAVTIAEWFKSVGNANYQTAHFGNWLVGNGGPENNGFDVGDGDTDNSDGDTGSSTSEDPKNIFSITDRAINFMNNAASADQPFFIQISHYAVHTEIEATASSRSIYADTTLRPKGENHRNEGYGAMTEDLDASIGLLLAMIDTLDLRDSTYVILLSDNGAVDTLSNNTPLREGKHKLWEGGIRVPMIIRGPGIPANSQSDVPVLSYDLYPTLVELVSGSLMDAPTVLNGVSLLPLFSEPNTPLARENPIYFYYPHYTGIDSSMDRTVPKMGLIRDNFKFLITMETGDLDLYDLDIDPGETTDMSPQNAPLTAEMYIELRDYVKTIDIVFPTLNPENDSINGEEPDLDEDGIDDSWEFEELLTASYDSLSDPDGDLLNNRAEFFMGTDPLKKDTITTSLDPEFGSLVLAASPNPMEMQLSVGVHGIPPGRMLSITLINLLGQTVIPPEPIRSHLLQWQVGHLPSGVYLLLLQAENGQTVTTTKLVKH
ncbi:sulfatase-like hydrolase/transferase [Pontibacter sp. G13]|uniref:sulfatase-like hydrolase/transferase n=1 Tax=Pontibacter sp. G13 TaxID=3074898 RepID=UPI00288B3405|nr:sulfatase-like hydrolase/transferase [Pontibacter sp. G13]WNJ18946.1 sulfatase-like hydrolase/transferase [Pontibacter sp. G13]